MVSYVLLTNPKEILPRHTSAKLDAFGLFGASCFVFFARYLFTSQVT